jgi:hypothetical protein
MGAMGRQRRAATAALVGTLAVFGLHLAAIAPAAQADKLFWTNADANSIAFANLAGGGGGTHAGLALATTSHRLVPIAAGQFEGHTWTLEMGRHGAKRCYQLRLRDKPVQMASTMCEANRQPRRLWKRVTGVSGTSASVELNITRPSVRRLKLLLGHPGSHQPPNWVTLPTRELTSAGAQATQLGHNFRYAVITGRGPFLCVKKVRAFSGSGQLLQSLSVPCEA